MGIVSRFLAVILFGLFVIALAPAEEPKKPPTKEQIAQWIKELGHEHTLLLSTHILPEVEMTCDSVIIINQGRVAAQGTLDGVRSQYRGKSLEDVFVQITGAVD